MLFNISLRKKYKKICRHYSTIKEFASIFIELDKLEPSNPPCNQNFLIKITSDYITHWPFNSGD